MDRLSIITISYQSARTRLLDELLFFNCLIINSLLVDRSCAKSKKRGCETQASGLGFPASGDYAVGYALSGETNQGTISHSDDQP
jgi:hypothetical protein